MPYHHFPAYEELEKLYFETLLRVPKNRKLTIDINIEE
jgi:hypothetical protein